MKNYMKAIAIPVMLAGCIGGQEKAKSTIPSQDIQYVSGRDYVQSIAVSNCGKRDRIILNGPSISEVVTQAYDLYKLNGGKAPFFSHPAQDAIEKYICEFDFDCSGDVNSVEWAEQQNLMIRYGKNK